MFTSAIWIFIIPCFYWGTSLADESWKNNPVINVTILDHVFCQQKQIKATFCIHCGSDFPDSVAVSIVKGEDDTNGEYQMLCVPPEWMCSGPMKGTYNTTSDALEIGFIFNLTVYEDHYLKIIHERNGSQEYQQIPLKQYNNPVINITVLDHVFCQHEQIKATFCIHCGSDFPDSVAVSIVKGENHTNGEYQMLCVPSEWMCSGPIKGTYNTTSDALEISFIFNFTVYEDHYLKIIHERNGSQEYQQIPLKQYKHSIMNGIVTGAVFCQDEQKEATLRFIDILDEDFFANTFSIFPDDTTNDALEMNFTSIFTALERYSFMRTRDRNGYHKYRKILLKPYNNPVINVAVLDHVFCQQEQIKATFCIHCGSDFPDAVAVSIVKGENNTNGEYQMLCVPPEWMCSGPIKGTYNTTSDALEISFIFNQTVYEEHYLRIIHEKNGSQAYQQIPLKQYKQSVINHHVNGVVFWQNIRRKTLFGIRFYPLRLIRLRLRGDGDLANTFSIFLYDTLNDALEMSFPFNLTVLEGYCIRIIHYRNGNQEYQQFLKPNSVTIAAYLQPYFALSSSRNAAKQRCTLPVGSCLHHVLRHRRQTYHTKCSYGYYGIRCENRCSENCYLTRRCDRVTGRCYMGCKPGWTTTTCKQTCPIGTFGPNCRQDCGHCFREDQCHFINGSCLKGCSSGYEGERCKYPCSTGYFGINCSHKCNAYCKGNSSCNHITGVCDKGCKGLWIGDLCGPTGSDSSNGITPILTGFVLQVAVFGVVICVF